VSLPAFHLSPPHSSFHSFIRTASKGHHSTPPPRPLADTPSFPHVELMTPCPDSLAITPYVSPCTDISPTNHSPPNSYPTITESKGSGSICVPLPPREVVDVSWETKCKKNGCWIRRRIEKRTTTHVRVIYERHPFYRALIRRTRTYRNTVTHRDAQKFRPFEGKTKRKRKNTPKEKKEKGKGTRKIVSK